MISGEKILLTGASGQVGLKLGEFLARNNEVWGLARFGGGAEAKDRVAGLGMHPLAMDLADPDFSQLPDDFTYVLHLSHTRRGPTDGSIEDVTGDAAHGAHPSAIRGRVSRALPGVGV